MSEVSCASTTRLKLCKHIYNIYTNIYSIYKLRSLILFLPYLWLICGKLQPIKKNITLKLPLNFVINLIFIAFPLAAANKSLTTDIYRYIFIVFCWKTHNSIHLCTHITWPLRNICIYWNKIYICNKIFLLSNRNLERKLENQDRNNLVPYIPDTQIKIYIYCIL